MEFFTVYRKLDWEFFDISKIRQNPKLNTNKSLDAPNCGYLNLRPYAST